MKWHCYCCCRLKIALPISNPRRLNSRIMADYARKMDPSKENWVTNHSSLYPRTRICTDSRAKNKRTFPGLKWKTTFCSFSIFAAWRSFPTDARMSSSTAFERKSPTRIGSRPTNGDTFPLMIRPALHAQHSEIM